MSIIKHNQYRLQKEDSVLVDNLEQKIEEPFNQPVIEQPKQEPVELQYQAPPIEKKIDLTSAKTEAESIVAKAQQEAEAIRQQAKQEGLMLGKEEGKTEAEAKIKEALETLNQAIVERKKIIKDSEEEILRLSVKIAEQIIKSEVSLHRDVCLNIVTEAIARVSDREQLIIRVNREDSEYLKRYKDRLAGILDGVKSFSILEDNGIEPGGCVIETNLGYIDAKISTKLKSIERALHQVATAEDSPAQEDLEPEEKEEEPELPDEN